MSNSQTRATAKYDKDHTKAVMLKLNLIHDADILARLESVDSKQGYIKKLVRNDIRGSGQKHSLEAIRLLIMPVVKKYGLTRVTLFGSYARGEETETSDVDIMIDGMSNNHLSVYMEMIDALEKTLNKPVDVVSEKRVYSDQSRAGRRLREHIEKDKVVIYEA